MHRRFEIETWRAVKYLLISGAVSLLLTQVDRAAVNAVLAARGEQSGLWLSVIEYAYLFLNVCISTLLNRYFTFRATEKWYIALPIMLVAALGWNLLSGALNEVMGTFTTMTPDLLLQRSMWMLLLQLLAFYLLQRCVIYCRTTDTNAWYTRRAARYGAYAGEIESGDDTDE